MPGLPIPGVTLAAKVLVSGTGTGWQVDLA
jgi:hypothetical protein